MLNAAQYQNTEADFVRLVADLDVHMRYLIGLNVSTPQVLHAMQPIFAEEWHPHWVESLRANVVTADRVEWLRNHPL